MSYTSHVTLFLMFLHTLFLFLFFFSFTSHVRIFLCKSGEIERKNDEYHIREKHVDCKKKNEKKNRRIEGWKTESRNVNDDSISVKTWNHDDMEIGVIRELGYTKELDEKDKEKDIEWFLRRRTTLNNCWRYLNICSEEELVFDTMAFS